MSTRREFLGLLAAAGVSVRVGQPELCAASEPAIPGVPKPWLEGECWTVEVHDVNGAIVHSYDVWGFPTKTWREFVGGLLNGTLSFKSWPSIQCGFQALRGHQINRVVVRDAESNLAMPIEFDSNRVVSAGQWVQVHNPSPLFSDLTV